MSNPLDSHDNKIVNKPSILSMGEVTDILESNAVKTVVEQPVPLRANAKFPIGTKNPVHDSIPQEPDVKTGANSVTPAPKSPEAREKELRDTLTKMVDGTAQSGVKSTRSRANEPTSKLNYALMTEQDVYDLDVPIEVIEHDTPDFLVVKLQDPEYVARWVHKHPARLGPMKAAGFTFVGPEDLGEPLKVEIEPDENGQYLYIDVYLMKCLKSKYFGKLRQNHARAVAMTNPKALHQVAQRVAESFVEQDEEGKYSNAFHEAQNNRFMEFYPTTK